MQMQNLAGALTHSVCAYLHVKSSCAQICTSACQVVDASAEFLRPVKLCWSISLSAEVDRHFMPCPPMLSVISNHLICVEHILHKYILLMKPTSHGQLSGTDAGCGVEHAGGGRR